MSKSLYIDITQGTQVLHTEKAKKRAKNREMSCKGSVVRIFHFKKPIKIFVGPLGYFLNKDDCALAHSIHPETLTKRCKNTHEKFIYWYTIDKYTEEDRVKAESCTQRYIYAKEDPQASYEAYPEEFIQTKGKSTNFLNRVRCKCVRTPLGVFKTVEEASRWHGINYKTLGYRLQATSKRWKDWYIFSTTNRLFEEEYETTLKKLKRLLNKNPKKLAELSERVKRKPKY